MKKFLMIISVVLLLVIDPIILYVYNFGYNSIPNNLNSPPESKEEPAKEFSNIPLSLRSEFKTDWSKINTKIEKTISGGPGKDGIPAINSPVFEPLKDSTSDDNIEAIVLNDKGTRKVYPYNILVWHEIVNDNINGVPISITFCPLCGSAIVFDRRVDNKELVFGVTGHLLESNMIMYDTKTESLWQQSTGKSLAGEYLDKELSLVSFQLLKIGQIKKTYPKAVILSQNTGFDRDYTNNPYAGYENEDTFKFPVSVTNKIFPPKAIFAVFKIDKKTVVVPWLELEEDVQYEKVIDKQTIFIKRKNGELSITTKKNGIIPFYFEMWFSIYVQNQDNLIVLDPKEVN